MSLENVLTVELFLNRSYSNNQWIINNSKSVQIIGLHMMHYPAFIFYPLHKMIT
jgi:hypothetical protein